MAVAVVGRFKKESYEKRKRRMDCPPGQKKWPLWRGGR